jgi:hypothetical protein
VAGPVPLDEATTELISRSSRLFGLTMIFVACTYSERLGGVEAESWEMFAKV